MACVDGMLTCNAPTLLTPDMEAVLSAAYLSYPQVADELFSAVHSRLVMHGSATKLDLAALVFWKHINNAPWMTQLLRVPDTMVRAVTAEALAAGLADEERVMALRPLPGFGGGHAIASTLFAAWDPHVYDVYDRLALAARKTHLSGGCQCDWEHLPTYWAHLRRVALELSSSGASWTPRMVDMALFNAPESPA